MLKTLEGWRRKFWLLTSEHHPPAFQFESDGTHKASGRLKVLASNFRSPMEKNQGDGGDGPQTSRPHTAQGGGWEKRCERSL